MAGRMQNRLERVVRVLGLMVALGTAAYSPAHAGQVATAPGAQTSEPLPERARAVLAAHCPSCVEAHMKDGALDLAAIAADTALVVPRRPDASLVYQRLLAAQTGTNGGPAAADVETIRDWIESLPARDAACRDRKLVTNADVAALIADWNRRHGTAERADTRFLSLVHLWNACTPEQQVTQLGEAVKVLLAALARSSKPLEVETLGAQGTVIVVRLSGLALSAAEWVRLMQTAPRLASADAAPADWLAAHVLTRPKDASGAVDPAFDVKFDAADQLAVESLARLWSGDVDLIRAAAERGVVPRILASKLATVGGEFLRPARRLISGTLPRAAWESLARALDGEARPGTAESGAKHSEMMIDVLLWTDKPDYRPRDIVSLNVLVDRACHLTLIDIDQDGKAIVLFPNELEQDNLIAPGLTVRIPGNDAGYQFRFEKSGEEQIVAICQRKSREPAGISYDYERQRFAILGDWRTFLRTLPEREKQIRARETSDAARRKRRGRRPQSNGPPAIDPDGPPVEGRTAITVTIDPGKP